MKIEKLEDLLCWQESRTLNKMIYEITAAFPLSEKYNLVKHMRECSRNVSGNIAEGFGRFHYQESMQFYRIARGSILELKSDLYCSLDQKYLTKKEFDENLDQIEKVLALLNGLIKTVISFKSKLS
jgi:four helix bundle protein